MTFLSIVTRHMTSRPGLYTRHYASLEAQTDADFEHVLIVDPVGRGMAWANAQLAAHAGEVTGEYVLVLDDDDLLVAPDAVATLKTAARASGAEIILFRADMGPLGILPDALVWQRAPVLAHVSGSNMIVAREAWQKHIGAWARASCGDFHFLEALWRNGYRKTWLDRVLVGVQRISHGAPE